MREPLERLFLREKPVLAILAVGEIEHAYAALVAKRIDSTFPHTCSFACTNPCAHNRANRCYHLYSYLHYHHTHDHPNPDAITIP